MTPARNDRTGRHKKQHSFEAGRFIAVRSLAIKKRAALYGPLYFSGTEALRADMKFASLSAAYIYLNALYVYKPAASCVAVGVADGVTSCRPAAAAITES